MANIEFVLRSIASVDDETGDMTLTFIETGNSPDFVPKKTATLVLPGVVIEDLGS